MTPSVLANSPQVDRAPSPVAVNAPAAAAPSPSDPPVVAFAEGLGKRFRIYDNPFDRLWEWAGRRHRAGKPLHKDFWAVKDVSFQLRRGQCLGIIGPNGSGKSTLLKMLTGALHPTAGTFGITGRVLSLIELGTGLNPMLAGRENIIHAATLLGFPATFAREKMEEIEQFAELGEFFDRPFNLYSSGMKVRLAFSMFACFRPELFIVDEALSVGDVFFQQKCAVRIREMLDSGMSMIFVSHDQSAILNLCDRAIVLNHGECIFQGGPDEAITRYIASVNGGLTGPRGWARKPKAAAPGTTPVAPITTGSSSAAETEEIIRHDVTAHRREHRYGTGQLRIRAARVLDESGHDALHVNVGDTLTFQVLLEAHEHVPLPRAGIRIFDRFNNLVFSAGTYQLGKVLPPMSPGDRVIVTFKMTMDVEAGTYTFGLGAGEPASQDINDGVAHDRLDRLGPFVVELQPGIVRKFFGIARLPMTATIAAAPFTTLAPGGSP